MPSKIRYAIHVREDHTVDWVGEIVEQDAESITVNVINAVNAMWGCWSPSGEVKTEPRSEWRLFLSKEAALEACHRTNERHTPVIPQHR